jgi:hypothetical protein
MDQIRAKYDTKITTCILQTPPIVMGLEFWGRFKHLCERGEIACPLQYEDGRKEKERLNRAHQLGAGITLALLDLQQSLLSWDTTETSTTPTTKIKQSTVRSIDGTEVYPRQTTGRRHRLPLLRLDSPPRTANFWIKSNRTKNEKHRFGDKWCLQERCEVASGYWEQRGDAK